MNIIFEEFCFMLKFMTYYFRRKQWFVKKMEFGLEGSNVQLHKLHANSLQKYKILILNARLE